ncbi:ferritin-like domain-domain-containing protein [Kockovaella imperatae]|uniref:Ferritin-like domain-domain-containing protein n=1 Tax=Kockovaella imperatae TaxID=4999 RepID=A0A1Y1UCR3_9TREE|nr:ferritin-like domain-domain-containing protein [Kockovaella imperatae]ORX35802.1 ferritin-like domain-domain-containing protein [Kockovaella imperatae]
MLAIVTFVCLLLSFTISAAPTPKAVFRQSYFKRQGDAASTDLTVVKFAALAESLESTFYAQGLAKFGESDCLNAGISNAQVFLDQIKIIAEDEKIHLTTLQAVAQSLGSDTSDVDTCQFDFSAALGSVKTFLQTARVLEFIGVDAYIGGATLSSDKSLLVSAAEILTVEARHSSQLNAFNGGSSIPNAFDMVLSPQQVLSVAAPFISGGCDPMAALGLQPTPALSLTNAEAIGTGTSLTFGGAGLEGQDQSTLFCNMIVGGASEALVFPIPSCVVPDGLDGPVHIFVTNSETPLSANIVGQDAGIIVAGPVVTFIDAVSSSEAELLLGQVSAASGHIASPKVIEKIIVISGGVGTT